MNQTGTRRACTPPLRGRAHGLAGRAHGFTLVELMITIFVAAILVGIAIPSFKNIIASSKLTSTANGMVNALNVARMEAIKRNGDAQFCSNSSAGNGGGKLGDACASQTGAVYVLVTTPANAASALQVHAATVVANGNLKLKGDVTALQFNPQGIAHALGSTAPYKGQVANIYSSGISSDNHRFICMTTGTIIQVIKSSKSEGACPP